MDIQDKIEVNAVSKKDLIDLPEESLKKLHMDHFPFWIFPAQVREIVTETNRCLNFPLDYISASLFFTCGLANGATTKLEFKNGWQEGSVLYLCLVGRSGMSKTHPIKFALKPIKNADTKSYSNFKKELAEYHQTPDNDKTNQPKWNKTLVKDITIEELKNLHDYNRRGLAVHADELVAWVKDFNKYKSGSDEEFWLSVWSNESIVTDRKTSDPIHISNPFISVIGGTQPKRLGEFTHGAKSYNGFIERLLFVIPSNNKKERWSDQDLPEQIVANWFKIIEKIQHYKLVLDEHGNAQPSYVRYHDSARELVHKWQERIVERYNKEKNDNLAGILSKHEIFIHRFALIIHIMYDACKGERTDIISVETINRAIELSEYFIQQSIKVIGASSSNYFLESISAEKRKFFFKLPEEFKYSKAIEIGQNDFKMNEKFVQRFLSRTLLFEKTSHGCYKKTIT